MTHSAAAGYMIPVKMQAHDGWWTTTETKAEFVTDWSLVKEQLFTSKYVWRRVSSVSTDHCGTK